MNVADLMYINARKYPDKEAIVFKDKRLCYREMDELSNRFANVLLDLGLHKGDRVAMMMRNSENFVAVYFGILKAGATVVPINISLLKSEVQFIVNNCEAKAFVFDGSSFQSYRGFKMSCHWLNTLSVWGQIWPKARSTTLPF